MIVYTDDYLDDALVSKTAYGILRFAEQSVRGVLASHRFSGLVRQHAGGLESCSVPILHSLDEPAFPGEKFVVGLAPVGGKLLPHQREVLEAASLAGYVVLNGLHDFIPLPGVKNLREWSEHERHVAQGLTFTNCRVLTVGTTHSVGKLTTTVGLFRQLEILNSRVDWVATGQTGLILSDKGKVLDSIPVDFMPGALERLLESTSDMDVVVVEGQGSLFHPSYSPTSLALFHVVRPELLVVCVRLGQNLVPGFRQAVPATARVIETYVTLARQLGFESTVVGISVDCSLVTEDYAASAKRQLESELGIPCVDFVRDPEDLRIADAVLRKSRGLASARKDSEGFGSRVHESLL